MKKDITSARKVIYTSLVGNIDVLRNPEYVFEGWDYICFSNDVRPNNYNNIWEIRPIKCQEKKSRRLSRYVKIKPHEVLPEYDYSIYIDSNIHIIGKEIEERVYDLVYNNILLSLIPHPIRDCTYKEAEICIKEGKDRIRPVKKLCAMLRKEGYPTHNGLYENGLIFRQHNQNKIIDLNNQWWNLYTTYSQRDQLSLGFLLWKNNISCENFFPKGLSVRNVNSIRFVNHRLSFLERLKRRLMIIHHKILWSGKSL